jgi:hypothetical protein
VILPRRRKDGLVWRKVYPRRHLILDMGNRQKR